MSTGLRDLRRGEDEGDSDIENGSDEKDCWE